MTTPSATPTIPPTGLSPLGGGFGSAATAEPAAGATAQAAATAADPVAHATADVATAAVGDLATRAQSLTDRLDQLSADIAQFGADATAAAHSAAASAAGHGDFFLTGLTVLILACFVGYYVVWNVTPALHSPLMGVTNAISSVIVVGAIIAAGPAGFGFAKVMGFLAIILASINIFGGFIVTQRMLSMFKRKAR